MKTPIHCIHCGSDFTVIAQDEPSFCCFCQEEIILESEPEIIMSDDEETLEEVLEMDLEDPLEEEDEEDEEF